MMVTATGRFYLLEAFGMSVFSVPTKILSGEAAFEQLKTYPITRACIICDPFVAKSGLLNKLLKVLDEMGADRRVFSDIRPDPDTELVVEGLQQILDHKPDAVIAVGGGSAIDAAKAISFLYQKNTGAQKPLCVEEWSSPEWGSVQLFPLLMAECGFDDLNAKLRRFMIQFVI